MSKVPPNYCGAIRLAICLYTDDEEVFMRAYPRSKDIDSHQYWEWVNGRAPIGQSKRQRSTTVSKSFGGRYLKEGLVLTPVKVTGQK